VGEGVCFPWRPNLSISREGFFGKSCQVLARVVCRQALDECGTFNPFLRGEEERELAYRLSRRGYSVVRVEHPMAHHLDKERSVQENTGRAVYFAGVGQIMRQYALQPPFWDLLREHSEVFLTWFAGFPPGLTPGP
jgi:hypothetical protein